MTKRITSRYKEGRSAGDLGYSALYVGGVVSKGSAFGAIYSSVEWLQHGIVKYLDNYHLTLQQTEKEDRIFLDWLHQTLFALSAFCYCKGNNQGVDKETNKIIQYGYTIPERALEFLEERVEIFKVNEEEFRSKPAATEFIVQKGTLNKLRIQVRDVERNYVAWFNEEEIIKESRLHPHVYEDIMSYQAFLNRLSTYFYWLTRNAAVKEGRTDWTQWMSKVPEFKL